MTLPASGTMNASMIYEEYYKIAHTTQVVDISVMSVRYRVAGATVGYDDFYSATVIDASIWRWWDLDGGSHLGQAAGNTGAGVTNEFLIDPCFGGFSAPPNISLKIDWNVLDIDYTKVVRDCTIDFEYDLGGGFINLATKLMSISGTNNYTWSANYITLSNLTPAQSKALRFRFAYTFSGVPSISDLILLNEDFSLVISSITGPPVYISVNKWKITQFQSDGAGNIDWNATIEGWEI